MTSKLFKTLVYVLLSVIIMYGSLFLYMKFRFPVPNVDISDTKSLIEKEI